MASTTFQQALNLVEQAEWRIKHEHLHRVQRPPQLQQFIHQHSFYLVDAELSSEYEVYAKMQAIGMKDNPKAVVLVLPFVKKSLHRNGVCPTGPEIVALAKDFVKHYVQARS